MEKKYIKLLNNQIDKLEAEDFDLEAWKSSTVAVLSRIFGKSDSRILQIEGLKIDYSSWALRDSNAKYKPIESCKRKGKEVLITAIEEIEIFGLDEPREDLLQNVNLKQDEIKILFSEESNDAQKEQIIKKLKKEDLQTLVLQLLKSIDV